MEADLCTKAAGYCSKGPGEKSLLHRVIIALPCKRRELVGVN